MDNAKYHKTKPQDTPNPSKMKKSAIIANLVEMNVDTKAVISAVELKQKLLEWVEKNFKAEVVQLAEAAGHEVVFTPPHYPDLKPIELVWALIKCNVGRKYSEGTTLREVKQRLDKEFERLKTPDGGKEVERIIRSVEKTIERLWKKVESDSRKPESGEDDIDESGDNQEVEE